MPIRAPLSKIDNQKSTYDYEAAEDGSKPTRRRWAAQNKFQDVAKQTMEQKYRREMLQKLLEFDGSSMWEEKRVSNEKLKEIKNKKLRGFYEEQNERINDWLEVDAIVCSLSDDIIDSFDPQDHDNDGVAEDRGALLQNRERLDDFLPDDEREKRAKEAKQERWAININVAANVLLLVAKAAASAYSSSISLIASLVDSALDLLCTLIILGTSKVVRWRSTKLKNRYPVGRRRLEPLGITVFSIIMVISFLQILQESGSRLMSKEHKIAQLPPIAIGAMGGTIGVKGLIWFACFWQSSTQVQALAQDCKTDVIFNTASLLFPVIGFYANIWWLDPVGAGILSLFIIYDWAGTCLTNVDKLCGSAVGEKTQMKLMLLAWRFSPLIKGFKAINAYHAGDGIICEVDLILDEKTDLRRAHDLAETMQYCFEGLKEVDRAFVSVDYAIEGPQGHAEG